MGIFFQECGKTGNYKYAKEFAKMILCLEEGKEKKQTCKSCLMFDDENHPDYYEINKEKSESIKIDEIRELQE
ncbi:MAG: DNA polymerase III subunit delta, partial [Clostridia bacterium]|nr:DNA polymerase III subunit delta [Clostridia bacterium]